MAELSEEARAELEQVSREGLQNLGASPEEIAHALEPGIPPEEMKTRIQAVIDARIHAGLEKAGLTLAERDAALDTSGTPEEQEARRQAVALSMVARKFAEDPERMARLAVFEATVAAAKQKQRARSRSISIAVGLTLVAIGAYAVYAFTRPTACDALLGTDAELSQALGVSVKREKTFDSKYFCTTRVLDGAGNPVLLVDVKSSKEYPELEFEMSRKGFDSIQPLELGEAGKLGITEPRGERKLEMADVLSRQRAGSADPVGDALSAMGPAGQTVIAKSGKGALRMIVYGSPELADQTVKWLRPRFEAVSRSSYK